jgi:hypothetical protein
MESAEVLLYPEYYDGLAEKLAEVFCQERQPASQTVYTKQAVV